MDSSGATTGRRLLRGEPARLAAEIQDVQSSIRALSLTNYAVHIANHKTEHATREQLTAGADVVKRIEQNSADAASRLDALLPQLTRLHGAHAQLRQTLLHHSAVVELLEAPSVMESCMRTGQFDEALDVAEYGLNMYFAHRLWVPAPPDSSGTAASSPGPPSIIARIVNEIAVVTDDVRHSLLSQLSERLTLPLALRLLGHLRRLYSQQALKAKRVAELQAQLQRHRELDGSSSVEPSRLIPSPAAFSLSPNEDTAIVEKLRADFLSCRDAWHRQELESIPRHNANQYLLRVVDAQRGQWADIATQFLAICHTVRPQQASAASSDAAANSHTPPRHSSASPDTSLSVRDPEPPGLALALWLQGRITWFIRVLATTLPAVDDGAHVAFLLQQSTYAARRAGRLGADYSHLLAPIFGAHIRSLAAGHSAEAATRLAASLNSWQWAHRPSYDDLPAAVSPSSGNSGHGASSTGTASSTAGGADATGPGNLEGSAWQYLQPPMSLMAFTPLAELANAALASYNALRPSVPVEDGACPWVVDHCKLLLQTLSDALQSSACPLVIHATQGRGVGGGAIGKAPPAAPAMAPADVQALRRFGALVHAAATTAGPFLAQLANHQAGSRLSAAGFEEPAAASPSPLLPVLRVAVADLGRTCDGVKAQLSLLASKQGVVL